VEPAGGQRQVQCVTESFLELRGLFKRFGDHAAVHDLSLALSRGEVLALLGPSGSGKTTALRLLAGFETPDAGRVLVDGQDVTSLAPARRRFGMVFQHYALFPHLDVGENVAFGLAPVLTRAERTARVAAALEQVDLAGLERRRVAELSGGQQQRVALARALAPEPRVLLLDEPLSNLDPALRERTRRELREVVRRVGITTVLVTHEQDEAFELGDRIALLRGGRLEQLGAPAALYANPETPFVASFLGRASRVPVEVELGASGTVHLRLSGGVWVPLEPHVHPGVTAGKADLYVRPEALRVGDEAGAVPGEVTALRFIGSGVLVCVRLEDGTEVEVAAPVGTATVGTRVGILPSRRARGGFHLFPASA
jgi:putative spermidine/putrescine transport system ATP-binding protein